MPSEALIGLFTLGGVILGATLASAFELWRRALDAQSAARIIRMEAFENRVKIRMFLDAKTQDVAVQDTAWVQHRITLAPVLSDEELMELYRDYAALGQLRHLMQGTSFPADIPRVQANGLPALEGQLTKRVNKLKQVEQSSRGRLIWRLLFRKSTGSRRPDKTTEVK